MTAQTKPKPLWPAAVAVMVAAVAAATLWGVYRVDVSREMRRQKTSLATLQALRRLALEDYLRTIRSELILYSDSQALRDAMRRLVAAWRRSGDDPASAVRALHLKGNRSSGAEQSRLVSGGDTAAYDQVHADFHPWAQRFREHHGYYDLFLADARGTLVYSVAKEDDFGTNLMDGVWRDTGLGRVVRAALAASAPDFVAFADFESYAPSAGKPASFIGSPIFDEEGTRLGVLALQMPTHRINEILHFTPGMGQTGETYLVGSDYLMRTDSRFADSSTTLRTRVETEAARRALAGETGVGIVEDYRGVSVLSAFGPIRFEGTAWALLAEIDEGEVRHRALVWRRLIGETVILLGLAGAAIALVLMIGLSRAARPAPWADDPTDGLEAR